MRAGQDGKICIVKQSGSACGLASPVSAVVLVGDSREVLLSASHEMFVPVLGRRDTSFRSSVSL